METELKHGTGTLVLRTKSPAEIVELARLERYGVQVQVKGKNVEAWIDLTRNGASPPPALAVAPKPTKPALSPAKSLALIKARAALAAKQSKPAGPPSTRDGIAAERMALYKQGLADKQIAAKVGATATAISQWRNVRKLKPNPEGGGRASAAPGPFGRRAR